MHDFVLMAQSWIGDVFVLELNRVGETLAFG
jgi:hypothetical protein